MTNAKKTKSGKYRIRVYNYTDENGKKIYECITRDTKDECEYAASEFKLYKRGPQQDTPGATVGQAVDQYIELCATLSPSTLASYRKMRKNSFPDLMEMQVADVNDISAQREINKECTRTSYAGRPVAPKTVKCEWGLISSALKKICNKTVNVALPKVVRSIDEFPDPDKVLQTIIGSNIELPCMLAIWLSFTMSEIRGIRYSSIRDGCIYIDQVIIDVDNVPTVKQMAKVDTRNRKLQVPHYILALINEDPGYQDYLRTGEDGFLVPLTGNQLSKRFARIMKAHNLNLTFHGLRHLNASIMLQLNVPEKYAMERGGWKTPHVMKTVYQHTLSGERRRTDAAIDDYFEQLLQTIPEP